MANRKQLLKSKAKSLAHKKYTSTSKLSNISRIRTRSTQENPFPIVGIGASAGGLEALTQLLSQLPPDTGMAFIVVQHLDPTHESLTTEILSRKTCLLVEEIKNDMQVQANHVYIIPPNHNLLIFHGVLKLMPLGQRRGQHMTIDFFFQSLALDQRNKTIGVILSGTASDGTKGCEAIKMEGGLTIAQDPMSAKYDGMPRSAIASSYVDLILTPQQIAKELTRFAHYPLLLYQGKTDTDSLTKIFALLRNQDHVDFTHYKHTTLKRRIKQRMILCKKNTLRNYLDYLQLNSEELHALFADFLINVTEFFRDPDIFITIKKQIFPKMMQDKQANSPIRIWIVGCATGEEAYSIAILLLEFLGDTAKKKMIQIFATDISEIALQKARGGVYPESIEKNVSRERLKRFFVKTGKHYKIAKFIRDMCLFSRHDVTSDPPFAKLDLICCRNLFIYFDSTLQKHVLPILHYALNAGGFLCLGHSESISTLTTQFRVVNKSKRLYSRGTSPTLPPLQFGITDDTYVPEKQISTVEKPSREIPKSFDLQHETEQLLIAEYAPPGVVINNNMEIVLVSGNTAPYLKLPPGRLSLNLFKMVRQEIVSDLRMMILAAKKQNARIKKENISISDGNNHPLFLNINVIPFCMKPKNRERSFLILFEPISKLTQLDSPKFSDIGAKTKKPTKKIIALKDLQIKNLNKQLTETKRYQRSLVEDYEATQEEVTSANEELQSTNEEFQSANEELETAKEELQSANEELTTLNDELQSINNELTNANSDLINLLETIDFPIIMVGVDGQIRHFTPAAGKLLNLIPSDIGRLIGNIKQNFDGLNLQALIAEVIETIAIKEQEINGDDDRYFRLQVRPYKTIDNRINGAVISFVDITLLKTHLKDSQIALNYATSIASTLPLPLVVLDEQQCFLSANQSFLQKFGMIPRNKIGLDLMSIINIKGWIFPHLRQRLIEVITKHRALKDFEIEYDFPNMGPRIMLLNAQRIKWQDELPKAVLLSIDDITDNRIVERELQIYQERFHIMVDGIKDYAIFMLDPQGNVASWNEGAERIEGYNTTEVIGTHFSRFYTKDDIKAGKPETMLQTAIKMGRAEDEGYRVRKDGTVYWANILMTAMRDSNGKLTGFSKVFRDSTERKKLSEQEKQARLEAEHANEAKDIFLATLSHELRSPLNAISGWTQLLESHKNDSDMLKRGLEIIELSAHTQAQLINDLLDISRIHSGKLSLTLTEIKVLDAVQNAIESIRPLAKEKEINIEMFCSISTGMIYGDIDRLQQIIWNLLTNSIKFSPPGSKIGVYIEKVQEHNHTYIAIRVVDHGKGIDPAYLPYLFDQFSQQDSSSIRIHNGLGIGLALVHYLVKAQDGSIMAESKGLEQGATFTLLFPLLRKKKQRTGISSKETKQIAQLPLPDLSGLKILLLDDESVALEVSAEIVKLFSGEPIPCSSVHDAMIAFEKFRPDVVVSNIAMPLEDGYVFIRKIRALSPEQGGNVPAMALTAYVAHHDITRTIAAGFQKHMAKPINNKVFAYAIARLAALKK